MHFTEKEIVLIATNLQVNEEGQMRRIPIADEATALEIWKKLEATTIEEEGKKIVKREGDEIEFGTKEKALLLSWLGKMTVDIATIEVKTSVILKLS